MCVCACACARVCEGSGGGGCLDIFLSSIISLSFLSLSRSRPDIDGNTVSKGR